MLSKAGALFLLLILFFSSLSCASLKPDPQRDLNIHFLDESILPPDLHIENQVVGGLSGITYDGNYFYAISDSPTQSRFFKIRIDLNHSKINSVEIVKAVQIFSDSIHADWEEITYDGQNRFLVSSEGAIRDKKMPGIYKIDSSGHLVKNYELPDYFTLDNSRDNGLFEGLASGPDGGFFITTEFPLKSEAPKPKLYNNSAKTRILHYNANGFIDRQQFYKLDRLRQLPLKAFALNGVSSMAYVNGHLLLLERGYYAGRGKRANRIRLFETDINTTENKQLDADGNNVTLMPKRLLFDFESIRNKLKHNTVDNLEGMCLGPKLDNGNQSLILIADNNFNAYTKQYNQIILLEIEKR